MTNSSPTRTMAGPVPRTIWAAALTAISGPMPLGSPTVKAIAVALTGVAPKAYRSANCHKPQFAHLAAHGHLRSCKNPGSDLLRKYLYRHPAICARPGRMFRFEPCHRFHPESTADRECGDMPGLRRYWLPAAR